MATGQFALSPEQESTVTQFFYRQLFITPPPLNSHEVKIFGKTAIITGSNSGIGFECASQLLDLGVGKLILAVRRVESGEEAKVKIASQRGESATKIEVWKLDMSEYDSIMDFTKRANTLARLDIVILNAGVRKGTEVFNASTGYEESIQVNFLSSFLLLARLLPIMKAKRQNSEPGRITLVSSDSARMALLEERNESPILPAFKRSHTAFNTGEQYNKSKVLMQLMMSQLAKYVPSSVANINMATPGFCRGTNITRELYSPMVAFVADNVTRFFGRSAAVGARVVVNAAVKQGSESHGQCIGDCKLKPMARLIYTEEGEALSQALWEELMSEFSFAGLREIMLDLKRLD
ncbi:NAD(P)-binding protein [Xylaria venustula]|nr:NAD(P)-binding protein [Xylaria venustula]